MATKNLKPLRDYDPHETINFFTYDGATADKGTVVKIAAGAVNGQSNHLTDLSATYTNTLSQRMGLAARVTAAGSGDVPFGMMLKDVRETDEHGEKYIFNRKKAKAEGVTISGEAVEILKRGLVLYSGVWGTPAAGSKLYTAADGAISTSGTNQVGTALGANDADGFCFIHLNM